MAPKQAAISDITVCDHRRLEPVLSFGGDTLAWRCKGCTKIMAYVGECNGCKQTKVKLTKMVLSHRRKLRFCDDQCHKRFQARTAKERADRLKAADAALKAGPR
jgi:hypothetical protein